jgi:branched-chain amino acid transport system substrate-binding protein
MSFAISILLSTLALTPPSAATAQTAKIAVATSLTGSGQFAGRTQMDAVRFAVEEANAAGATPPLELNVYDDKSTEDGARQAAHEIATSEALAVVGPSLTVLSLTAGPIYAEAGIVSVVPTAHGDRITDNATTFRTVFSTGEIGEALVNYLHYVLGGKRAIVVFKDNGYGRPFADGFKSASERLGVSADYFAFTNNADREESVHRAAATPGQPAILLGMTFDDAVPAMVALRRRNAQGLILGTATMARAGFADLFKDQPEEQKTPGCFTRGVYAASPMILDSANADMLAFAERYRARYGKEPSWEAAQGYDAVNLVAAAVRAAFAGGAADLRARRETVRAYLASLNGPANAISGVTGPIWFTGTRGRQQAVRIGRFHGTLFESAPLQLVPVSSPTAAEIASGQSSRRARVSLPGGSRSSTAVSSLTKFPEWTSPSQRSRPIFIYGCGLPAAPAPVRQCPPKSISQTWFVAISMPRALSRRVISMTARPIGCGESAAISRTTSICTIIHTIGRSSSCGCSTPGPPPIGSSMFRTDAQSAKARAFRPRWIRRRSLVAPSLARQCRIQPARAPRVALAAWSRLRLFAI